MSTSTGGEPRAPRHERKTDCIRQVAHCAVEPREHQEFDQGLFRECATEVCPQRIIDIALTMKRVAEPEETTFFISPARGVRTTVHRGPDLLLREPRVCSEARD